MSVTIAKATLFDREHIFESHSPYRPSTLPKVCSCAFAKTCPEGNVFAWHREGRTACPHGLGMKTAAFVSECLTKTIHLPRQARDIREKTAFCRCSARISRTGSTLARSSSRSGTGSATSARTWTFAHVFSTQPVSQFANQAQSGSCWLAVNSCVLFACCASQRSQA